MISSKDSKVKLSEGVLTMKKETYDITGMTCSACSARIEKMVAKMDGAKEVSVNLLKNNMTIKYDESLLKPEQIINKIVNLGYGAAAHNKPKEAGAGRSQDLATIEMLAMKKRLITSIVFAVPLLYIAMAEMLHLPLPGILMGMENSMIYAFTQFLLVLPIIIVGRKYFIVGFKNIYRRSPNMDSLIALGSGAAFAYGVYAIYRIAYELGHENMEQAHHFSMYLYFESAGIILTLITLGKFFEARAKSRTSDAINKLMNLTPKTALVIRDGVEITIPVEDVVLGDIIVVKAGDSIPVDGIVREGFSAVDESAITGESIPVEKEEGSKVTGGTINKTGYIKMEATAVGQNTTLAKIIQLVDEATASKAPIAKLADKISGIFVPIVIVIALVSAIIWLLLGHNFEFALSVAISILVISCPCALGLATPTAIMVGTGRGASKGILIKSAQSLEITHAIDTVVLDKTGTVTEGKPIVTDIITNECTEDFLLGIAASLEIKSGHPLADSIDSKAKEQNLKLFEVSEYENIPGQGIKGIINSETCFAGNKKLMNAFGIDIKEFLQKEEELAADGKTPLYFAKGNALLGLIAVADPVKPTSREAIEKLTSMGIDVIMLTGDNAITAEAIRKKVSLKTVISEVLPEDKELEIRRLQEKGHKVAMVGDGINDAPALARSDVGIAIGAGTDIAIESADIVLMKSDLMDVPSTISLSKAVMKNIKQNLFWAFIYNIIGIPIAAGVLYLAFGVLLNPMIAAAAMSFSSVSVVTNALRLRLFTPK